MTSRRPWAWVKLEVPIMLQGEAKGDAKVEMRVIDGETRSHVELRYDPVSRQLQSSHRITGSAASQAPTAKPLPAKTTGSLGLQLKVGADLQLRVLESVLPVSASLRANLRSRRRCAPMARATAWAGSLNCLARSVPSSSWAVVSTYKPPCSATLAAGRWWRSGQLRSAPNPSPTPTPTPDPTPVPTDGLDLLPLPLGAQLLEGFRLAWCPIPPALEPGATASGLQCQ